MTLGATMARVLVVDDDALYRGLVVEALRLEGHEVFEAHSAESALRELSQHNTVEVMICDLQMNGLDGIELLQNFKTNYPRIPVVVVSAHPPDSAIGARAKHAASAYLSKPFSVNKLLLTIRELAAPTRDPKARGTGQLRTAPI
jgi:CheY-like chemotaxis protein